MPCLGRDLVRQVNSHCNLSPFKNGVAGEIQPHRVWVCFGLQPSIVAFVQMMDWQERPWKGGDRLVDRFPDFHYVNAVIVAKEINYLLPDKVHGFVMCGGGVADGHWRVILVIRQGGPLEHAGEPGSRVGRLASMCVRTFLLQRICIGVFRPPGSQYKCYL